MERVQSAGRSNIIAYASVLWSINFSPTTEQMMKEGIFITLWIHGWPCWFQHNLVLKDFDADFPQQEEKKSISSPRKRTNPVHHHEAKMIRVEHLQDSKACCKGCLHAAKTSTQEWKLLFSGVDRSTSARTAIYTIALSAARLIFGIILVPARNNYCGKTQLRRSWIPSTATGPPMCIGPTNTSK